MFWLPLLFMALTGSANSQHTTQTSVAPDLRECYHDPYLTDKNNLPPTTIQVLIDIIRKIEDHPDVNMDLRQLSVSQLHTYRQDGIEYHPPETYNVQSSTVLPFAPTFHSFHRHYLLLTFLIPNNLQASFPNTTISSRLKCALHHMLSTTVDTRVRGDEGSCSQLAQYRALRTVRSIDDDVELLNPSELNSANKNGKMRQFNPNNDVEYTNTGGAMSENQINGVSTCPLLGGVISTEWGAVSAGHLIAGIAAGTELQRVQTLVLAKGSVLNYPNVQSTVSSIFPATVSGDLAEAILIQGTERASSSISIGLAGGWNSTQGRRYYMLPSHINAEMTDPEIRGDIDGFVLGNSISNFLGSSSNLKLSTLLDMYYSPRHGVFNEQFRACNRRALRQQFLENDILGRETYTFAAALDTWLPLRGTIIGGLDSLVESAVANFQTYTGNTMNDMNCETSVSTSNDYRTKTNLYIALDASWPYAAIYPAISYLLDEIEVSKFGSSVTLLNAFDGSVIVNTTFSLAEFHLNYTLLRHQTMMTGVNLQISLANIKGLMHEKLRQESLRNYVGGNSTVLLYLINSGNIQNNLAVWEEARALNDTVPDLRILFASSNNQFDNLWNLVRDMHNDIKTISLSSAGTGIDVVMKPVLERIKQTGRRIINPLCGPDFPQDQLSGSRAFDDYVSPDSINFYRISPNYFYKHHDNRRISITRQGGGVGSLVVCQSRVFEQPRGNATIIGADENAINCTTIANLGSVDIFLHNACDDYWTINSCPPLYISVQLDTGIGATATSSICTDAACRFPFDLRYQVHIEDLGCFSGCDSLRVSVLFVLITFIFTVVKPL